MEVRERLEKEAGGKRKKGFMTPERKKKLSSSLRCSETRSLRVNKCSIAVFAASINASLGGKGTYTCTSWWSCWRPS